MRIKEKSGVEMGERGRWEREREEEKKAITAVVWLCWFTACKCQMQHRLQCVFLWHSDCIYCGCATYRIRNTRNTNCKYVFILFCKQEMTRGREREIKQNKQKRERGNTWRHNKVAACLWEIDREREKKTTSKWEDIGDDDDDDEDATLTLTMTMTLFK